MDNASNSKTKRPRINRTPTADLQDELIARFGSVVGMDEVGRGALAGPLAVGAVMVDSTTKVAPAGLADSKLIPAHKRESLIIPIRQWCVASAVGWASPEEISVQGVTAALRLAGIRALAILLRSSASQGCVLLDGNHNWLQAPKDTLFDSFAAPDAVVPEVPSFEVITEVKADMTSQVVAAASILAKVARDRYMVALKDPGYHWHSNKGYASSQHLDSLRVLGPCRHHRLGWKLPGVTSENDDRTQSKGLM